jgi:PKD repeat protein
MKSINFIAAAALSVLTIGNVNAQTPYQFIKVTMTSNSNDSTQAPATTVVMFGQGENDSLAFPDAGNEGSIGRLNANVFPFSRTADNYIITNFDARGELDRYKAVPFGFVTKNAAEIKVTAIVSNSNGDTIFNLPGYVWLEQISTGEKFSILNDTAKFNIPANDNFATDFILHTGPACITVSTEETCYNTADATVTLKTPNHSGSYFELKDANGIVASGNIAGTDTTIYNLPAGNYFSEILINNVKVDSSAFYINPKAPLIADFSADYNSIIIGNAVNFTDNSVGAASYLWDFGDGNSDSNPGSVSHTYAATGSYAVNLTIADANGCTSTVTDYVSVNYSSIAAPQTNVGHGNQSGQGRALETEVTYSEGAITVTAESNINITITAVNGAVIFSGTQYNSQARYNVPANGVYLVTAVDANGNKKVTTVTAL